MDFGKVNRVPAIVVVDKDPNNLQRIKVNAPTLFDSSIMGEENLPWIYPKSGGNSFTSPRKGQKVWVYNDENNYNGFWYEAMFEQSESTQELSEVDNEVEVLLNRDCGNKKVQVYYNSLDGLNIKNGDKASIILENDNDVQINGGSTSLKINSGQALIGNSDDDYEYTVKGETLKNLLSSLSNIFGELYDACDQDGHLQPLKSLFNSANEIINKGIQDILTTNTKVN